MDKRWCMCKKLNGVARDTESTCSICGGKDAYGGSNLRPAEYQKITEKCKHESCHRVSKNLKQCNDCDELLLKS